LRFSSRATFARILCLFNSVGYFDHQVGIRQTWVVGSNFSHGFIGCAFDFLFMAVFDVFM
jgi:hypothetical protein